MFKKGDLVIMVKEHNHFTLVEDERWRSKKLKHLFLIREGTLGVVQQGFNTSTIQSLIYFPLYSKAIIIDNNKLSLNCTKDLDFSRQ